MNTDEEKDQVRQTVKDFMVKKYKEKKDKIYGTYHNGGPCSYPTRQVDVCKGAHDSFAVTYCCGSYMWQFNFTKEELLTP